MGLAAIVGGIALVPLSLAVSLYGKVPLPVTFVLGHSAAAGLIVAASASTPATARRTTKLLGKDARSGRITPASIVAWWPYHLGLRTKLWIQWRKSKGPKGEPLWNKVTKQLYIGGWPKNQGVLPATKDLSVVDVTCELPRTHETGGGYLCVPTWDTHAPNAPEIQSAVDWSLGELRAGREVYVHCAHGHGRSATVLAAILIASGQAKGADDAVKVMRQARPKVRLNGKQRAALESWIEHTSKLN